SDSELVAMRAAGVGTGRIVAPVVLLGAFVTLLTLYVGMELAPEAAHGLRQSTIRAALYRLESPVEPRTFNTEMPGKVIYVREGDQESGQWGKVFIYWPEGNGSVRLVTARSGRIDTSGEHSELVLSDASVTTLSERGVVGGGQGSEPLEPLRAAQVTSERSTQLRLRDDRLNAGRETLLKRLQGRDLEPDEMDWRELLRRSRSAPEEKARRTALFNLHKKLALCSAPLVFAFFGALIGLRMRRGGRGLGMLLSLASMIAYYLIALAGEYLARVGIVPMQVGAWLATSTALLLSLWLFYLNTHNTMGWRRFGKAGTAAPKRFPAVSRGRLRTLRRTLFAGLLDRTALRSLFGNFSIAYLSLVSIFLIFTLFELLRFIAVSGVGGAVVARYLLFLLPLATVALAPMSVLVSVLVVYALMARRSEAIAWWACGQSIYRLTLPCIVFAACIGLGLWTVQEKLLPEANHMQNELRTRIRGRMSQTTTSKGRQWLATLDGRTLYSYEFAEKTNGLRAPVVYGFDADGVHLERVSTGEEGNWNESGTLVLKNGSILELGQGGASGLRKAESVEVGRTEPPEAFKPVLNTPAEMDIKRLSNYINSLKRRGESVSTLLVALERKRADPFSPVVMALIGVPLALAFGRRSAIASLCAAIAVGLTFWGSTSGFQQLGNYGLLSARIAVWSPLAIFAAIGVYLLFRART
ncbi:MAG TPA: LptF/LptG family permease, partial [Pyrinomonadaceae bacterium]|nr:LptF/LptG family permease [Pyrinomonadaceae bacterium]